MVQIHSVATLMSFILPLIRHLWARIFELNNYRRSGRLMIQQNVFDSIPTDLVLEIASWLPYSCATSLALRNRKLFFALGEPVFTMLNGDASALLQCPGKDLLDVFFCSRCRKLHFLAPNRHWKLTAKKRYSRICECRCKAVSTEELIGDTEAELCGDEFTLEHVWIATNLLSAWSLFRRERIPGVRNLHSANFPEYCATYPGLGGFESFSHSSLVIISAFRSQTCALVSQERGYGLPVSFTSPVIVCDHSWPDNAQGRSYEQSTPMPA